MFYNEYSVTDLLKKKFCNMTTYVCNVNGDIFCNKILTALQKELFLLLTPEL